MPSAFEVNPTLSFTLLGTFAIYLWQRPARSALLAVFLLAIGLRAACVALMDAVGAYYGARWISWGAFLGIASLMVLAAQIARSRKRLSDLERKQALQTFYAGAVFPLCSLLIGDVLRVITWLRPRTYDALLLAFDGSLGFQPSFILARLLSEGTTFWGLTTVIYYALPLGVGILLASQLQFRRLHRPYPVPVLALFLSLMVVGFVPYVIYPATGPAHAFPEFYPWNPHALTQVAIQPMTVPDAPRNCMPSLHLAGALAILWNSYLWPRWGRLLAALFVCATIFSTLALGEHYLVDLVVAFPFTLILQAVWSISVPLDRSVRRKSLVVGTTLTVAWLVMLRYGLRLFMISPLISWTSILLTVAWCRMLQRKLSAAARVPASETMER